MTAAKVIVIPVHPIAGGITIRNVDAKVGIIVVISDTP
jgi:hypothetical protein